MSSVGVTIDNVKRVTQSAVLAPTVLIERLANTFLVSIENVGSVLTRGDARMSSVGVTIDNVNDGLRREPFLLPSC